MLTFDWRRSPWSRSCGAAAVALLLVKFCGGAVDSAPAKPKKKKDQHDARVIV